MESINHEGTAPRKEGEGVGFFKGIFSALKASIARRRAGAESPLYDLLVFGLTLLLARCHIIFGAYPVALAFISVLPTRVWIAVAGAVVGGLTLGEAGIVYAMIALIVAFLRVIISGTDKSKEAPDEPRLFDEGILLRMSAAVIGGFIAAVYEILLNGFSLAAVLFGSSMVILPPLIAFGISGLFEAGITPGAIFSGTTEIFSAKRADEAEKYSILFFQCSALFLLFLVSISLKQYELLGISLGYVFAGIATIFVARRFGPQRGAIVGFTVSVGLSSVYSVAFLLLGIAVGVIPSLSIIWAVTLGGVAIALWGGYSEGLVGLLSLLPEYMISAAVSVPLFKKLRLERSEEEVKTAEELAQDMTGTMALSYKSKYTGALDRLEGAFSSLSSLCAAQRESDCAIRESEIERLVTECINEYFDTEAKYTPGADNARRLFLECGKDATRRVYKRKHCVPEDFDTPPHLSSMAQGIAESISHAIGIIEEAKFHDASHDTSPESFSYIAKLINEARLLDAKEKSQNESLTERAKSALLELGLSGFSVLVFGERVPHIILAAEDKTGATLTSPSLKSCLESALGISLSGFDYYRRGKMALMECSAGARYSVSSAYGGEASARSGVSGDTVHALESADGKYYGIISDGMGSGEDARAASQFVLSFLTRTLDFGGGTEGTLSLLGGMLRGRPVECSASLDLFSFDLISGEATFFKCGSSPSYIKRGSSLYRIRSRTSPLGISSRLDAERVKVEVEDGDYVIMFSDGISADGEAPWLIELLGEAAPESPEEYLRRILDGARKCGDGRDDISVLVSKINLECVK